MRVLYAGRLTKEKGVDLLADAFLAARARDPRLELHLAGGGPEEDALRARLGGAATFLGWLEGEALARAYADADLFLFCSQTDTFGQVVLEAQASGVPVVAVDAGGPSELIANGRSGLLCPPRASALADALAGLAAHPGSRRRLATGGLAAVSDRTWDASLAALGAGWRRALLEQSRARPARHERVAGRRSLRPRCGSSAHARCASSTSPCSTASARADPDLPRRQDGLRAPHRGVRAPGGRARRDAGRVRSGLQTAVRAIVAANGYRLPLGTRPLVDALRELSPDVVLLHDPFWAPRAVQSLGVPVVMVHHGSLELDAAAAARAGTALPARAAHWLRRAYARADAVMAACDPQADSGRPATLRLRFGLDPAFYPEGDEPPGEHVLYAGRLGHEKGVFALLEAAARSAEPWPLWLMGAGAARGAVAAHARRLGLPGGCGCCPTSATVKRSPPATAAPAAWSCRASWRPSGSSPRGRGQRRRDGCVLECARGACTRRARRRPSPRAIRPRCWPRSSAHGRRARPARGRPLRRREPLGARVRL